MPIYEYVCQSCGRKTEVLQRIKERPLKICPHCGGKLKKAFSAPAIQFKGSGWYVTDYARAKKEEKKGASGTSASDSGDSESKKEKEKEKPAEKKAETKKESGKSDKGR
jgi:putative FmdB family regulatory protein